MRPPLSAYLDCSATTPVAAEVLETMQRVQAEAWANPSSLHGFGYAAAEQLERSRQELAELLGAIDHRLVFTSGGSESIHLALLGVARSLGRPGRLLISSVEHPATRAAAEQLQQQGWQLDMVGVDRLGLLDLGQLEQQLRQPTDLVSLIWGQSEVGSLQPIEAAGRLCRQAGALLHLDAVQVVGHLPIQLSALPVDLLSLTAHKLMGPRGIGALLLGPGVQVQACIGGGGQEGGLRAGTEAVPLAAGLVRAVALASERLAAHGGSDPIGPLRDQLLERLLVLPGLELSGPDPRCPAPRAAMTLQRLPHHLSLLVSNSAAEPVSGRRLVQSLWQQGFAASSGSACSSGRQAPSPVLLAMGYTPEQASSSLRLSLGPWHNTSVLAQLPAALERARSCL